MSVYIIIYLRGTPIKAQVLVL